MALYTISVTEEDIREGDICDCEMCPVARAMQRELGRNVHVDAYSFAWDTNERGEYECVREYPLPFEVRDIIHTFDDTGEMEPFTFTVNVEL